MLEDVRLPYLETFAQAAERNSFTSAARALALTQAAVSQRIAALEKELGTALFRRQAGSVLLTDAGRMLYDYAQRILELHRSARAAVTGQKAVVAGDLLIGASSIPGEHLLPQLLAGFRKRFPKVQVHVRIADSQEIINQLEKGKVQVGLIGQKPASGHLEIRRFATDRMTVAVPADHPWAKRRRATLKQLIGQPLILREPGSGLRHCFEKSLTKAGLSLDDFQIALELGSNEAIKSAVLRGNGIAILSLLAVRKEIDSGQLAAVSVRDLKCDRDLYVAHDRRRALAGPARAFLVYLETHPVRS